MNSTDSMDENNCKEGENIYLRVILAVLIDGDLIFLIAFLQQKICCTILLNFFVHIFDGFLLDFKMLKLALF